MRAGSRHIANIQKVVGGQDLDNPGVHTFSNWCAESQEGQEVTQNL